MAITAPHSAVTPLGQESRYSRGSVADFKSNLPTKANQFVEKGNSRMVERDFVHFVNAK